MVLLLIGLVILTLGLVGLLTSYFGASIDYAHRSAEIMNWDVNPGTLVAWGAVSALLILLGAWLTKRGSKRAWQQRKDQKALAKSARQQRDPATTTTEGPPTEG